MSAGSSDLDPRARTWFATRTSSWQDWSVADVIAAKGEHRVAVVIPARDEEETIADVVTQIRRDLVTDAPLVDELVVMDSLSSDHTAKVAADAGATVHSVADVRPDLGVRAGKGEALWKSLFVTSADLLVFIDADLTDWGPHFVTGLVGPLLASETTLLVKGFYDRQLDFGEGVAAEGGRVTELVARPWLALNRPELSAVVQPLAGEWAVRRAHIERLSIPVGYGIEIATLIDTADRAGVDAIAQVDLGRRGHRHQNLHDLGAMAYELLAVAERRNGREAVSTTGVMPAITRDRTWQLRTVDLTERPPAVES
jgi:glucosyl-3-phosphoglycerate synthase